MDVIIFCGGRGSRMSDETYDKPKPMINIGDKPILWHIMKMYSNFGFKRFILTLGYKGSVIKEWFDSNLTNESWDIEFVETGIESEKGARLKKVENFIKSKDFIIQDLCNYGYWRCFDKSWSQQDFFKFGKFLNDNLREYPQEKIIKLSNKKNKKIKIGFLSADIKEAHSVTYFLKTVLLNYDKSKFEIVLFTNQIKEDKTSEEFTNLVDKTINVGKFNDFKALNTIREFNLDIMIDIMGYTSRNRIELYKNRLAKKQVIWMGYCNTSGLDNMDYIITDPTIINSKFL